MPGMCVSYNNLALCDGAGAQLQRIAEVYGICRLYNYKFSNVDILKIDSNPGDGMNDSKTKDLFLLNMNEILVRPLGTCDHTAHADVKPICNFLIYRFKFPRVWLKINELICLGKTNARINLSDLSFTRKLDSKLYSFYKNKIHSSSQFIKWVELEKTPEIQIHFLAAKPSQQRMPERYTHPQKVINVLKNLQIKYPKYKTLLHTDLDENSHKWSFSESQTTAKTIEYWRETGIIGNNNEINLNKINPRLIFSEAEVDQILTNISPLEVWKHMANAEILICAKSSLSFIGGLINIKPNAQIFVPNGYINYPKNWNKVDF